MSEEKKVLFAQVLAPHSTCMHVPFKKTIQRSRYSKENNKHLKIFFSCAGMVGKG